MSFEAILQPVVVYSVIATVLMMGALMLFVLRLNFKALEKHVMARQSSLEKSMDELTKSLAALSADLEEVAQREAASPVSKLPGPGLNLSKRSQALRLHRRGEGPDQIASALNLPPQEVELLLKVHQIVLSGL